MMALVDIHLRVPSDRSACAAWLLSQEPATVAEALGLCEAALMAVRRDVSEGESAKLQKSHHVQVCLLQEQLEQEKELRKEALRDAKQRAETAATALERRHKDTIDALQEQLAISQDAYHQTQQSTAEQKSSWQKELDQQLRRTEEAHNRKVALLQQKLDELDVQLIESRASKQRLVNDTTTTLNNHHKDSIEALQEQLTIAQEAHHQAQKNITEQRVAWQKELEQHLPQTEEAHHRKAELLQQKLDDLDAQLTESRAAKQRLVDDAIANVKRRLEEDYERRSSQLLTEIDSLKRDLELKKGNEAQKLLDEKRHGEDLLRQKEGEYQRNLEQVKEERLKYEGFLTAELEKRSAELANALASKDAAAQRVEVLVSEHRELVSRLGGSSARGQLGERFVANVFSKLQLGDWQDDHGVKDDGYADALWTWQASPTTPVLSCLVEIKYVAEIHSHQCVAKFHRDLQAAAHNNRANAGLFISLAKHYTGKPSLQLTMEHGMPCCYASRDEDDSLPAACLVQLAFQAMATAWPLICRQRGEGVELTVRAASEQLEEQLSKCAILSKHVANITRLAATMMREAKALEKLRDGMVKGIECVRMNHPSLVPELPEVEGSDNAEEEVAADPWTSPGAQQYLASILAGKKGNRYPQESSLSLEGDAAIFAQSMPKAFTTAKELIKEQLGLVGKGRKRKATDAEKADDAEE